VRLQSASEGPRVALPEVPASPDKLTSGSEPQPERLGSEVTPQIQTDRMAMSSDGQRQLIGWTFVATLGIFILVGGISYRSVMGSAAAVDATKRAFITGAALVLLCYKKPRQQQGQRGRERARWVASWRRRVAMECGLCRSVLTGSPAGPEAGRHAG